MGGLQHYSGGLRRDLLVPIQNSVLLIMQMLIFSSRKCSGQEGEVLNTMHKYKSH